MSSLSTLPGFWAVTSPSKCKRRSLMLWVSCEQGKLLPHSKYMLFSPTIASGRNHRSQATAAVCPLPWRAMQAV